MTHKIINQQIQYMDDVEAEIATHKEDADGNKETIVKVSIL